MSVNEIQWWLAIGGFIALLISLKLAEKMPSTQGWHDALASLNSRGGNILILSLFSVYFFHHAMTLFYHLLDMVQNNQLKPDNAFALMALQFASATAFGGFSGALLKTMTGDSSRSRSTDGTTPDSTTDNNSTTNPTNGVNDVPKS